MTGYVRHTVTATLLLAALVIAALRPSADMVALMSKTAPAVVAIECHIATVDPFTKATAKALAAGSGVIVDSSGLVVTNFHVVKDAISIKVTMYNGMSVPATLVGADPNADLAVLRLVGVSDVPYMPMGRAEDTLVGQQVVALGNAHALGASGEPSLTAGILGGKHRRLMGHDWYEMDAQIYPGNSGGPVCDMSGRVIGISVAISNFLKPFFVPLDARRRAVLKRISGGLLDPPA